MTKITPTQYAAFCVEYYNTKPQHLRLGQAFFNKFLKHEDEVDNLFYVEKPDVATRIILDNYVDFDYEEKDDERCKSRIEAG